MKARRIAFRVILFPFVALTGLVFAIVDGLFRWVFHCVNYARFGGETTIYNKYHTPTTLADILNELQKLNNLKNTP